MNRPSRGSPVPDARLPDALRSPRAWPGAAGPIELVETHISWVFLVDELAYKVKKPVKLDFLDFSTPALREHFCREELRLNQRFTPQLYLGLSQVVSTPAGLVVDGRGPVVDHAVRMRRFDRSRELDALIARDGIDAARLAGFGARLARSHDRSPATGPGQPWAGPDRTLAACRENFAELRRLADPALRARAAALEEWTGKRFPGLEPRFRRRLAESRFRECHGDLHCANVVEHGGDLLAFDALEFDPGLHWIDVANDLAFLWMDLRARGRSELAAALLDGWLATSGDFDALGVLRFYEVYRACVRAKVAAIRLGQRPAARAALEDELVRYLEAASRAMTPARPRLVLTTGVSGSGKSWLAERLLGPLDAVRIRSDVERKRLAGLAPEAHSGGRIYSKEMNRGTYDRLASLADAALRDGFSVVVDAASLKAGERSAFRQLAGALGLPFRLLDVSASADTLARRVAERASRSDDPSEATAEVLSFQLATREPLQPDELPLAVHVDTDRPVDADTVVRALLGDGPCGPD
jgi:aminoglycoside phosphotransferase family enzyme/predicted kinase